MQAQAQAFIPAVNKDGYSHLTFMGFEVVSRPTIVKNNLGEVIAVREHCDVFMQFEVKGFVKGTSELISINVGEVYSEESPFGILLQVMGFQPPTEVVEEEGFYFEVETEPDVLTESLKDFLDESVGNPFIAKLSKVMIGRKQSTWQMDFDSFDVYMF